jgi:hypothetical protein
MDNPAIKQLDHVIARVDDATALHRLFTETLQLPVSWAVKSYDAFTSGGISLGNVMLEILSVGADSASSSKPAARFCAFVFECDSLEKAIWEIKRRGLKCSSVVPYIQSPSEGLPKVTLWSNAFLDGLTGTDFWTRYIIFSTKLPGYMFWAHLLRGSKIEQAGMSRLFGGALVFLVEYEYQNFKNMPFWSDFKNHDEKRTADAENLRAVRGGALGLESVREIVVSVKDYEQANQNWEKLLSPVPPRAQGLWEIADGPAVRLAQGQRDAIEALVFKVSDLAQAKTFLREKDMLDSTASGETRIDPSKIYGLDIRLV